MERSQSCLKKNAPIIITAAARGVCHSNVSICRFVPLAEMIDAVVLLGTTVLMNECIHRTSVKGHQVQCAVESKSNPKPDQRLRFLQTFTAHLANVFHIKVLNISSQSVSVVVLQ